MIFGSYFAYDSVGAIETTSVEVPSPDGPFGAKGIGESSMCPSAPAIANAIYNAIGVRFTEIPINIRSVLDGVKKTER